MSILERQGGYCVKLYIKDWSILEETGWLFDQLLRKTCCVNCYNNPNYDLGMECILRCSLVDIHFLPGNSFIVCSHWRNKEDVI